MSALPLFDTPRPVAAPSGPRSLLKLTLRDYQQQAVDGAFAAYERGEKGALIRQPTGTGKTIVGSACIDRWLGQGPEFKALVIAHERQLIWQFAEEIHDVLGITPAIEMASQRVSAKRIPPITVASRATLAERVVGDEVGSRLYKFRNQFNWLIIWDEAHKHHPALPSCRHIIDWFDGNPENRHLGLSATPERTDKKSLKTFLPAIAIDFRMITYDGTPSAITEGWCVPYDQRFITVESIDFTKLSTVKGDFDENELEAKLADAKEMAKYVKPMLDLVEGRSTIIFNPTRLMADKIARYINAVKGRQVAYSLDGTVPEAMRKDTYTRFNKGAFQFLSVCGLCREGFNSRICSAVAIFRPTKSRSLAEQMKGRGCRPLPGVVDGLPSATHRREAIKNSAKADCMIIDLVGVSGIADCASTAHIYAEGLDDRVVELANRSALKKGKAGHRVDMAEEVRKAKAQYDKEQAKREERKRQREENKKKAEEWRRKKAETDRLAQEEMDRLAALGAEVTYHQRQVRPGMGGRVVRQQDSKHYVPFGKYRGQSIESVPSGYLHWLLKQQIKPELRNALTQHLDKLKKEKRVRAQPQQVVIPTGINYMDLVNSFLKRG